MMIRCFPLQLRRTRPLQNVLICQNHGMLESHFPVQKKHDLVPLPLNFTLFHLEFPRHLVGRETILIGLAGKRGQICKRGFKDTG